MRNRLGGDRLRRWSRDDGSTLPLVTGFTALALAVVLVVVAASSLYLAHKRLLTIADGAALAAAEGFELDDVTLEDGRVTPHLTDAGVTAAAAAYLAEGETDRRDPVALITASSPDGRSAVITLASAWAPPLIRVFVPDGLPLEVTTTARSIFR
ncbi:hypothetical protein DDQ50_08755 [Amnibacterium flavum]|uniref:Putative Flp pilus-assembly TadG-like N-terminal domain-containing protein n=2 Tax=Amnibacterium flavum TaxID=2173173 RepID=A0A2V1HQH3_9MICO|nr:hypothetical protein DDQ50_08755 [Amnibacterium flavum]